MHATWYVNFMVMLKVHKQHGLSYNFSFVFTASGWDSAPTAENQQLSRGPPLFLSSFEFSFNLPPPHNAIRSLPASQSYRRLSTIVHGTLLISPEA